MGTLTDRRTRELQDLPVLDQLREGRNISQRTLGERLGMAASQVNRCIRKLLEGGLIRVVDTSVRPYAYDLTVEGEAYRRLLRHQRVEALAGSLREMREQVRRSLREIEGRGLRRLVLFGAGEVMEVAVSMAEPMGLEVVGLVDDDPGKQGRGEGGLAVHSPSVIRELAPDAVLLTAFRPAGEVRSALNEGIGHDLPVLEL